MDRDLGCQLPISPPGAEGGLGGVALCVAILALLPGWLRPSVARAEIRMGKVDRGSVPFWPEILLKQIFFPSHIVFWAHTLFFLFFQCLAGKNNVLGRSNIVFSAQTLFGTKKQCVTGKISGKSR